MSLVEELAPIVEAWARAVVAEAADARFAATQALCPVGIGNSGEASGTMLASGKLTNEGDTRWNIEYDDVGYTDEGPEPHDIYGNPYLSWEGLGGERIVLLANIKPVHWVPGEGVARNIGWFSNNVTDDIWLEDLQVAAEAFTLGD